MTYALRRRGPNFQSSKLYLENTYQLGLGHARLSILDLSASGNQPMVSPDSGVTIIHNGEVYNFSEIRKELLVLGYSFKSNTDTEVILNAYIEWGISCVNKFIGMFAFAIFDHKKNKLILCRDRAGVKPLFYYNTNDLFLFGSELKSFHKHPKFKKEVNINALGLYFKKGYISAPHCIFENCYKLEPGHYLEIDLMTKTIKKETYWDVIDFYNKPKFDISDQEAINKIEDLLISACNYRMVSDVPVGVFLSSGYDSTNSSRTTTK